MLGILKTHILRSHLRFLVRHMSHAIRENSLIASTLRSRYREVWLLCIVSPMVSSIESVAFLEDVVSVEFCFSDAGLRLEAAVTRVLLTVLDFGNRSQRIQSARLDNFSCASFPSVSSISSGKKSGRFASRTQLAILGHRYDVRRCFSSTTLSPRESQPVLVLRR